MAPLPAPVAHSRLSHLSRSPWSPWRVGAPRASGRLRRPAQSRQRAAVRGKASGAVYPPALARRRSDEAGRQRAECRVGQSTIGAVTGSRRLLGPLEDALAVAAKFWRALG